MKIVELQLWPFLSKHGAHLSHTRKALRGSITHTQPHTPLERMSFILSKTRTRMHVGLFVITDGNMLRLQYFVVQIVREYELHNSEQYEENMIENMSHPCWFCARRFCEPFFMRFIWFCKRQRFWLESMKCVQRLRYLVGCVHLSLNAIWFAWVYFSKLNPSINFQSIWNLWQRIVELYNDDDTFFLTPTTPPYVITYVNAKAQPIEQRWTKRLDPIRIPYRQNSYWN